MSLPTLPQEVLEHILLYVNAEDVLSVLKVLRRPGSEAFWRRVCLQNGYEKSSEEETWKEVVLRNIAWLRGSYVKREYDLDDLTGGECGKELKRPTQTSSNTLSSDYIKMFPYLKGNKLVCQKDDEVLLMDAGNPRILLQKLQGQNQEQYNQSRTKLLLQTSSSFVIYDKEEDHYKEMFDLNKNHYNMCPYLLTDDYFVLIAFKRITVVSLHNKEGYSLRIVSKNINFFNQKKVVDRILNILVLEDTNYCLRRLDLEMREWLEDLLLFGGATMISVPQIEMNHKFAASCCLPLEGHIASIKVWSLEANMRRVSTLTHLRTERIFWLLLHANYLIHSSKSCWFSVLNLNKPDEPETMVECDKDSLGQTIVSRFLVLSYKNGFKLVDFKKATYVCEVFFDGGFAYDYFYVNEYFYLVYNVPGEVKGQKKLCVYDFRVGSI